MYNRELSEVISMSNLKITSLKFSYDNKTFVFKDLNFTLRKDKTLSIIGTPNSGKTTLLVNLIFLSDPEAKFRVFPNKTHMVFVY